MGCWTVKTCKTEEMWVLVCRFMPAQWCVFKTEKRAGLHRHVTKGCTNHIQFPNKHMQLWNDPSKLRQIWCVLWFLKVSVHTPEATAGGRTCRAAPAQHYWLRILCFKNSKLFRRITLRLAISIVSMSPQTSQRCNKLFQEPFFSFSLFLSLFLSKSYVVCISHGSDLKVQPCCWSYLTAKIWRRWTCSGQICETPCACAWMCVSDGNLDDLGHFLAEQCLISVLLRGTIFVTMSLFPYLPFSLSVSFICCVPLYL